MQGFLKLFSLVVASAVILLVLAGILAGCSSHQEAEPHLDAYLAPPPYTGGAMRTLNATVFADKDFSDDERPAILAAIQTWNLHTKTNMQGPVWVDHVALQAAALNGTFNDAIYLYRQPFVGDQSCPSQSVANGWSILDVEPGYYGYTWGLGDQSVVCVIPSAYDVDFLRRVVMHELGHAFWLGHENGKMGTSVMFPDYRAAGYPQELDALHIEERWK